MEKIDVTHTAKPDPKGRRLFLDPATGRREWEVLPGEEKLTKPAFANPALTGATEEYHAKKAATVDAELAKVAFGMTIDAEKKFEAESRPTKPVKYGRHKANEGDK